MADTTARRYSIGAMIFHWTIAVAVIWNWRLAENAHHTDDRAQAMAIFADHKALGITVLVLTIGRLLWRWTHPVPPLPSDLAGWHNPNHSKHRPEINHSSKNYARHSRVRCMSSSTFF